MGEHGHGGGDYDDGDDEDDDHGDGDGVEAFYARLTDNVAARLMMVVVMAMTMAN